MTHSSLAARRTRLIGASLACLLSVMPVRLPATQTNAPCSGPECALTLEAALAAVAQVNQRKQDFVGAVRQLIVALPGTFGDEGTLITATVQSMTAGLDAWDRAILAFEARVRQGARPADIHIALGVVYLDRYRLDAALREFSEAERLDPRRADAHTFQALVYTISNKPAAAAAALAKASAIDRGRAAVVYSMSRQLALAGRDAEATAARRAFVAARKARLEDRSVADPGSALFQRVALLRQVPDVAPIFPPALYAGPFALLAQGDYTAAVALFRQAIERDPLIGDARGRERLGQGSAALRAGNVRSAIEHLQAAVSAEPDRAEAHRLLAIALREADQYEDSIEAFRAAIRLNPGDERPRMALADVYGASGRDAEAERALQETIASHPGSGQAYYSLGRLYRLMAKNLEAARALERAAERHPLVGADSLYEAIGTIYLAEGELARASDAFQARVDVSPNNAEAHRRFGEVLLQRGRHDEALAEFEVALLIDSNDVQAYAGIAQLRLQQGEYAEAAAAAQRAVGLDPTHPGARYSLGAALLRLGRRVEGQKEIEEFERMQAVNRAKEDRDWELRLIRQAASTHLEKGEYERVADELRKVIPHTPDDPNAYIGLGVVLKRLGRHAEAVANFQKALELKAGADVHRLLAESLETLGRLEESRRHREIYDRAREDRLKALGGAR
jgi:tetratricopeptide (TPR) repeat protein